MDITKIVAISALALMPITAGVALASDVDQTKEHATDEVGPARQHKDDGVKYGDRDTHQAAGHNKGETESDDEDGVTGGDATHTRGDGKGGGSGGKMGGHSAGGGAGGPGKGQGKHGKE